jgi:hypothetical protein
MEKDNQSESGKGQTSGQVPKYKDPIWVHCKGYRCMAYTDAAGKWINFNTGKELTDFVEIIG